MRVRVAQDQSNPDPDPTPTPYPYPYPTPPQPNPNPNLRSSVCGVMGISPRMQSFWSPFLVRHVGWCSRMKRCFVMPNWISPLASTALHQHPLTRVRVGADGWGWGWGWGVRVKWG